MPASRRTFLASGAAGVGLAVAGSVPSLAQAHPGRPRPAGRGHVLFPPLVDDPDGILALPAGFTYTVVTRAGCRRPGRSDHRRRRSRRSGSRPTAATVARPLRTDGLLAGEPHVHLLLHVRDLELLAESLRDLRLHRDGQRKSKAAL